MKVICKAKRVHFEGNYRGTERIANHLRGRENSKPGPLLLGYRERNLGLVLSMSLLSKEKELESVVIL